MFERDQDERTLDLTNHLVRFAVVECVHGVRAHAAGQDAIADGGRPAALEVPEHQQPRVEGQASLFELLRDSMHTAGDDPLGHDDDPRGLAAALFLPQPFHDLIDLERQLGNQRRIGAGGQRGVNGDLPAVPAHHLDQEQALGGIGGVADLVDGFGGGPDGAGEADADVGARKVVVDGAGTADDAAFPVLAELDAAAERAVAADGDQVVDAVPAEVRRQRFSILLRS